VSRRTNGAGDEEGHVRPGVGVGENARMPVERARDPLGFGDGGTTPFALLVTSRGDRLRVGVGYRLSRGRGPLAEQQGFDAKGVGAMRITPLESIRLAVEHFRLSDQLPTSALVVVGEALFGTALDRDRSRFVDRSLAQSRAERHDRVAQKI
jgi:hypothetical protein